MDEINQDPNPNTPETPKPITHSSNRGVLPLIFLVVIAAVGGIIWYKIKNAPTNQQKNTPFANTKVVTTPPSNQSEVEGTSTVGTMNPPTTTPTSAPATTNSIEPTPTPNSSSYNNTDLGFSMAVPKTWAVKQTSKTIIAFFDTKTGKEVGYIEVYPNNDNQSLGDLTVTLENSPDVSTISYTTLSDQPALQFTSSGQFKNGIATVYNNRIYYLRGNVANSDIVSQFQLK